MCMCAITCVCLYMFVCACVWMFVCIHMFTLREESNTKSERTPPLKTSCLFRLCLTYIHQTTVAVLASCALSLGSLIVRECQPGTTNPNTTPVTYVNNIECGYTIGPTAPISSLQCHEPRKPAIHSCTTTVHSASGLKTCSHLNLMFAA